MTREKKDCQIVIRVAESLKEKIEIVSEKEGMTTAAWVRRLIIRAIKN